MLLTILTPLTVHIFALLNYYLQFLLHKGDGETSKVKSVSNAQFSIAFEVSFEVKKHWVFYKKTLHE